MTEYRHPGSESMGHIVSDLERHRGPGPGKALWRSWLFDGWRFGAVDLSSDGAWPRVVGLACGDVLSRDVQERLVRHLRDRGGLLLLGPVPTRDTRGRACTVLADALGVRAGQRVESSHRHFASVRGVGPAAAWDEMRVDWWQPLTWDEDEAAVPLVEDVGGAVCGLGVEMGPGGRAVVLLPPRRTPDPGARPPIYSLFGTRHSIAGQRPVGTAKFARRRTNSVAAQRNGQGSQALPVRLRTRPRGGRRSGGSGYFFLAPLAGAAEPPSGVLSISRAALVYALETSCT